MNQRTHVVIPGDLVRRIDSLVGKRGRSRFLADAASHELKRLSQIEGLRRAAGSWKGEDHPELKAGSVQWVKSLRAQDEKRHQRHLGR
ncbi:MAG TPA: hypothetical protein VNK24_04935 [Elusimicrobiota bacterium]|nr:hypothetical protein [Elusimicrobiota bacterium]